MSLRLSRDQSHHGGTTIYPVQRVDAVNVLDNGRAAAKKEKPKRAMIVLLSFFLSGLASSTFVYGMNHYGEDVRWILSVFRGHPTTEQMS
jgi:hypothetical protein